MGPHITDSKVQNMSKLTAASRAQLMQRLPRDPNAAAAPAAAQPNDGLNHDPGCTIAPMPQCCILLRNMFDPRQEAVDQIGEDERGVKAHWAAIYGGLAARKAGGREDMRLEIERQHIE